VARKSYKDTSKELAYQLYYKCRPNLELTMRELAKHPDGFPVTRGTLAGWRDLYGWDDRAARQANEAHKATDAVTSAEERAISSLDKVRARYEREDLIEALATDLLERRALQIVLDSAEYEEVPFQNEDGEEREDPDEAQERLADARVIREAPSVAVLLDE